MELRKRTFEEIERRVRIMGARNPTSFEAGVLCAHLPRERARRYTPHYTGRGDRTPEVVLGRIAQNLPDAMEMALQHRIAPALNAVQVLAAWTWLLGDDELSLNFELTHYPPYGVPRLALLYDALGRPLPNDRARRMAKHKACMPECTECVSPGSRGRKDRH